MNSNPEPASEELEEEAVPMTLVDRIFQGLSFLWFQRKMILGVGLTAALAYGVYSVYSIPPPTFNDSDLANAKQVSIVGELPTADINFNPNLKEASEKDPPKIRTMEDIVLPEKKKVKRFDPILDAGTIEELIEEALSLKDNWIGKAPPIKYLMFQRRAKIARKILTKPTSESEQIFALGEYFEAIILLDNLVCERKYKTPQVRLAMDEVATKYSRHANPVIRAKSNLAAVVIPLHDFIQYDSEDQLKTFVDILPSRLEFIVQDEHSTERLAGMAMLIHQRRNWDGSSLPYAMEVARQLEATDDEAIQVIGLTLREQLNFSHLEPDDLVDRISLQDYESRRDVRNYFKALEANPNVRLRYFQVAISAIRTFKDLGKKEDYNSLLDWMRRISANVKSEASKTEIEGVIKRMEELPFGPTSDKETDASLK